MEVFRGSRRATLLSESFVTLAANGTNKAAKEDTNTTTEKEESDDSTNRTCDETEHTKDELIEALREEVVMLRSGYAPYYASENSMLSRDKSQAMPCQGMPAHHVKEMIVQLNQLDNKPRLNTSSYVNVVMEKEEEEVALLGSAVNLADGTVYPASIHIHDAVVSMIAKLWHAPTPRKSEEGLEQPYSGAGTVGSTEACLLSGLALKFRWRKWYSTKFGVTEQEVKSIVPNIIISTCYQAAWEKFFKYMDVEPRFVKPTIANQMRVDPAKLPELCDNKTIAVIGILGNHYNGAYDPIWEIDKMVTKINKERGFQIGIHVDAASGGFIAPFQEDLPPWDFRLDNVLTISASGHKFGESICGTGWVIFRQREDLADHIAISVTYLGGTADSFTLNFSRPATAAYVQYYKFLRLGWEGYKYKVKNQMKTTQFIRETLRSIKDKDGNPRFCIIDCGDMRCLPVVGARLNPCLHRRYDDIDFQHALAESHWYVCGYSLSFPDPTNHEQIDRLLEDCPANATMFRIVVKSNLTFALAEDLADQIRQVVPLMDSMEQGYNSVAMAEMKRQSILAHMSDVPEVNLQRGETLGFPSFRRSSSSFSPRPLYNPNQSMRHLIRKLSLLSNASDVSSENGNDDSYLDDRQFHFANLSAC